jgi:glycosyltransferase involved in cell wall biosynthesis
MTLKNQGFKPDIILCHPGWGEGIFIKEIFPRVPLLFLFEFFYHPMGVDVGFDSEFPSDFVDSLRVRTKNANNLITLNICDHGVTPTNFQLSVFPDEYKRKISVIFDGVDTNILRPDNTVEATFQNGNKLTCNEEIITFVNRNLEPYRGWHSFARSIPIIQALRPNAHILIIGGDDVSYGSQPKDGISYKHRFINEIKDKVDWSKVYFTGRVPYNQFVRILQLSSVHVYLTYPFVLSWSMIEAMSCGCLVIGSKTLPVEEVIQHEINGLLVDFFNPEEIALAVNMVLNHPDRMHKIREKARETVINKYDLKTICLPAHIKLINDLANKR